MTNQHIPSTMSQEFEVMSPIPEITVSEDEDNVAMVRRSDPLHSQPSLHRQLSRTSLDSNITTASSVNSNSSSLRRSLVIDKHLHKLPQVKELQDLVARFDQSSLDFNHLNITADREESTAYEFIIENQRGITLFGLPLFSEKALMPSDPPNFQLLNGNDLDDINLFPLPDFNWIWGWPKWYVLMISDVDDQGWIYSRLFFRSKSWKGKYQFGNFVRRRIWCRMRINVESNKEIRNIPPGSGTVVSMDDTTDNFEADIMVGNLDSNKIKRGFFGYRKKSAGSTIG